ncbi:MAG: type II toxin-antitoxin system VapC family toxin [Spirosomaceae bacterium]|nr:type II toxin-antitoxin system VapC family toxin [Spirosomataceae bacterium]
MIENQAILLDTNAVINFLNGESLEVGLIQDKKIVISEITEMEIQCIPTLSQTERKLLKEFLGDCIIIRLNELIKDTAIKIRLSTRLKLMDAIIAATAQTLNLVLVTSDEKFESIKTTKVLLFPSLSKR